MGEKDKFLELIDGKEIKQLLIRGVDVSKYLTSYSITSTQNAKDVILKFSIPNDKVKAQVDWVLFG